MYQPLTDRARKVMLSANQEALRFNHELVATEHVLLALVVEGRGVGVNVLRYLNVDLRKLRFEIESHMTVGPTIVPRTTRLPQTAHAAKSIGFAIAEADFLCHDYIGTEHLLLGLLREDEGRAAQILLDQGVELHAARKQVVDLLESGVRGGMPILLVHTKEIEDLPAELTAALSEVNAELERLNAEKEKSVAEMDFEKAASLRDSGVNIIHRKRALIGEWLANYPLDAAWLSCGGGAALKLAQRISARWRWDALPELADVLEKAGCTDSEILAHCRKPGEHSHRCWVVDLLLSRASVMPG